MAKYSTGSNITGRLVAEKALGKSLPTNAAVHHHDENRQNNKNNNLVICENNAYHLYLHHRTRILRAGGDPNLEKLCSACKKIKKRISFSLNPARSDGYANVCRECFNVINRAYKEKIRKSL